MPELAQCTFSLNSKPISALVCDGVSYPAFSGRKGWINDPKNVSLAERGALPPGRYYIIDRQSGGRLGWLWDFLHNASNTSDNALWFALYADDGKIDDWTFIQGVKRGNFRLHPVGTLGYSDGCITLSDPGRFTMLRTRLLASPPRIRARNEPPVLRDG
ncbi:DUF2778 domain-containing protein [Acetobacter sacchari]|uniref:DUF2778 domain-containing protein n=1 Tax=Acetobacter sacchari TaxID=2661687 RepID=A0ABS3LU37_9PROT|nr:DUF2778 domain-containing protein [Acetobacter sacchari]MBO1359423.1 DUF2778 domain-containing protein [Acetobacter sacchari]